MMLEEIFEVSIFLYVIVNLMLLVIYKYSRNNKILHRILSVINTIILCLILGYGFYRIQPIFVIFVPIIFLFELPISWGLNKELSDDEAASLVILKGFIPFNKHTRGKIKLAFIHFVTFPFFYLLDSWSKS